MAPAAKPQSHQNPAHHLSKPTPYGTSTQKLRTVTETITSTTFVSNRRNEYPSTPRPHIHGIVPGTPRLNPHSLPLSPPLSLPPRLPLPRTPPPPTPALPSPTNTNFVTSRRSTYPRASPPNFLYPSPPIIPKPAHTTPYHPPHTTPQGRMDNQLAYLPPELRFLFVVSLGIMVLAALWTCVVALVNCPPGRWACWGMLGRGKGKGREKKERRPVDKPSRYGGDGRGMARGGRGGQDGNGIRAAAVSSTTGTTSRFHHYHGSKTGQEEGGIELTHRHPHRRAHPSNHTTTPTQHPRSAHAPAPQPTVSVSADHHTSPTLPSSSPINPFLYPPTTPTDNDTPPSPTRPRTSPEWLTARNKYFNCISAHDTFLHDGQPAILPSLDSCGHSTSTSPSPSPSTTSSTSACPATSFHLSAEEVSDMEAGTSALTRVGAFERQIGKKRKKGDKDVEGVLGRSLSWLDQGLGMVDGAVGKVVDGLVRWGDGDEEEGERGLLLPVAVAVGRGEGRG